MSRLYPWTGEPAAPQIAELEAWRARFPQYIYRPQDECVTLKLDESQPQAGEDTPEAIEGTIQVLKECGGFTEQAPVIRQLRRYATLLAALTTQGVSHGV